MDNDLLTLVSTISVPSVTCGDNYLIIRSGAIVEVRLAHKRGSWDRCDVMPHSARIIGLMVRLPAVASELQ